MNHESIWFLALLNINYWIISSYLAEMYIIGYIGWRYNPTLTRRLYHQSLDIVKKNNGESTDVILPAFFYINRTNTNVRIGLQILIHSICLFITLYWLF